MNDNRSAAAALGFPTYVASEAESFPGNSSPYVFGRDDLFRQFADDAVRMGLLKRLERFLGEMEVHGIRTEAVLIGGGFVRRIPAPPSDLDGLALYRLTPEAPTSAIQALSGARRQARRMGLDLRFCPADADTVTMTRSIAFFATLYAKAAGSLELRNGLLLYDRLADTEGEAGDMSPAP